MPILIGALICIAAVSLAAGIAMFVMLMLVAHSEGDAYFEDDER